LKKFILISAFLFICSPALAATKTWQNGGVNNNWSTAGNWFEGSKPAAGDDVVMSAAYNCYINETTANLNSIDMTGYSNTLTSGAYSLVIKPSSGTTTSKMGGTIQLSVGVRVAPATGATVNFYQNSATWVSGDISIGSKTGGTFNGTVILMDNISISSSDMLELAYGTLRTDGATDDSGLTHSIGLLDASNSDTRTLTLGNCNLTVTGGTNSWVVGTTTGLTFNCGTSDITFTGAGVNFNHGAVATFYNVTATGGGNFSKYSTRAHTFNNLTVTGTAVTTDRFQLYGNITVNGALALSGNSASNRLWVRSITPGTVQTITLGASATLLTGSQNLDFMDITVTGGAAGERDLSALTGLSGDCGGNTGITFTTAEEQDWDGGGADDNWSTALNWNSRVPLPQDDVTFLNIADGTTVTIDMPRIGHDIDCHVTTAGHDFAIVFNLTVFMFGSLDLTDVSSLNDDGDQVWVFYSKERTGTHTIVSSGLSIPYTVNIFGGSATYELGDAFSIASTGVSAPLLILGGTFDAVSYNVTAPTVRFDLAYMNQIVNMGSGTWTLRRDSSSGDVWITDGMTVDLTVNGEDSTIYIDNAASITKTFEGAGETYNNITVEGGTGPFTITGSNTFNAFVIQAPKTVTIAADSTQTISSLSATGTAVDRITLRSSSAGTHFHLIDADGGQNLCDYLDVTDSNASPASTWYYGANGSGDAYSQANGWAAAPTAATSNFFLMFS
jgi:hypothetical protein